MITDKQLSLLQHTLGNVTCYRNYFNSCPEHIDEPDLLALVSLGYMEKHGDFYTATTKGIHAAWEGVRSCYTCQHLFAESEAHYDWHTCSKVKQMSTLHQFPFKKTTCKKWVQR